MKRPASLGVTWRNSISRASQQVRKTSRNGHRRGVCAGWRSGPRRTHRRRTWRLRPPAEGWRGRSRTAPQREEQARSYNERSHNIVLFIGRPSLRLKSAFYPSHKHFTSLSVVSAYSRTRITDHPRARSCPETVRSRRGTIPKLWQDGSAHRWRRWRGVRLDQHHGHRDERANIHRNGHRSRRLITRE